MESQNARIISEHFPTADHYYWLFGNVSESHRFLMVFEMGF